MFENLLGRIRPYFSKGGSITQFMESRFFFLLTITLTLVFDYFNIEPIENAASDIIGVETGRQLKLVVITILLGLDFVPILLGYFLNFRSKTMINICKFVLVIAFGACLVFYCTQRMTFLAASSVSSSSTEVDETEEDNEMFSFLEEEENNSSVNNQALFSPGWFFFLSTSLLLTITPLLTSVITFSVSVIRKHGAIVEKIAMLEGAINENEMLLLGFQKIQPSLIEASLEKEYENLLLKIDAENQLMKANFRKELLKNCDDAQLVSLVSQIALSPPPALSELFIRAELPPKGPPRIPMPSMMRSDATEPTAPFTDIFVPVEVVDTREVSIAVEPEEPTLTLAKRVSILPEHDIA